MKEAILAIETALDALAGQDRPALSIVRHNLLQARQILRAAQDVLAPAAPPAAEDAPSQP